MPASAAPAGPAAATSMVASPSVMRAFRRRLGLQPAGQYQCGHGTAGAEPAQCDRSERPAERAVAAAGFRRAHRQPAQGVPPPQGGIRAIRWVPIGGARGAAGSARRPDTGSASSATPMAQAERRTLVRDLLEINEKIDDQGDG